MYTVQKCLLYISHGDALRRFCEGEYFDKLYRLKDVSCCHKGVFLNRITPRFDIA